MACFITLAAIFGLASLVPDALACTCISSITLQNAYCSPYRTSFLIQAKVVAKSGVFVSPEWRNELPDGELDRYYFLQNFGRHRYYLEVTDVYVRPSGRSGFIRAGQNVTLEALIGGSVCGAILELGTTYVLAGAVEDDQTLTTSMCDYKAAYDSRQQLQLPNCQGNAGISNGGWESQAGARRSEEAETDGWRREIDWDSINQSMQDRWNTWNSDWVPRPVDNEPDEEERSADNDAEHPMSLLDVLKQE